jgi:sorting nexin-29
VVTAQLAYVFPHRKHENSGVSVSSENTSLTTIFFKTVQILAYADDIDLMARTINGLKEAFSDLEKSARNTGLVTNQEKTVYMHIGKDITLQQDLVIGNHTCKRVDNFKYLGTMVNKMNNRPVEVNAQLTTANRSYYGLQYHMKSRITVDPRVTTGLK